MSSAKSSAGEDLHVSEDGAAGRGSADVWWRTVPSIAGEKLGVIGSFFADTAAVAGAVLRAAEDQLRIHGCTLAVGPMNGSTWRHYRFVTSEGDAPPFFLEPTNPPTWPAWWRDSGYGPLAEYYSTATDDLARQDQRLDGVAARMHAAGITIRPLNRTAFEAELTRIHDVSVQAFQDNFLYTPLERAAFVAQYAAFRERLVPELILLAEQKGRTVGYVFATPDYAQAQRGEPLTTFIVKTLAVLPGRAYAGLGALLLAEVHASAGSLKFKRAIHALMHETNRSRNLSAHYADTIRRYTLFSKRLMP